jgi:hypothetical protein
VSETYSPVNFWETNARDAVEHIFAAINHGPLDDWRAHLEMARDALKRADKKAVQAEEFALNSRLMEVIAIAERG